MSVAVLPCRRATFLITYLNFSSLSAMLPERVEPHVDLGLAGGRHLVVVHLDVDADRLQRQHHLGADVLVAVRRRHREVAFLVARLVAEVRLLVLAAVPEPLDGVEVVVAVVVRLIEPHVVEDEELRLGAEVRRVGDAGRLQVALRLRRDVARVAAVGLAGDRVPDVADQHQRRHRGERIEERAVRIGEQEHVALLDRLEPADRRAVEADALLEDVGRELLGRHCEVLPHAGQIDESQIDRLDRLLLDERHHILGFIESPLLFSLDFGDSLALEREPSSARHITGARGRGSDRAHSCAIRGADNTRAKGAVATTPCRLRRYRARRCGCCSHARPESRTRVRRRSLRSGRRP